MKVITHDETAKADCVVKVNGNSLQEFNNGVAATDGAFCLWIPVEADQKLTVEAGCNVYMKEVQFDLVIDGILRSTTPSTSRAWAHKRRTVKFNSASRMWGGLVADADLVVKDLPEAEYPADQKDGSDTVGCI